MAATRTIGRMQEFYPDKETVTAYLERFQMFVSANSIETDKVVPTLLTVLGSTHYTLLRGLVSPELLKDKSYDELVELLKKHYDPEPIIIAERFHFYRCDQKTGESIADYLAALRRLASRCKFGTFLTEALRDKLVCGMQSDNIQKVLLTKANLTLDKAVEISQGMEAAAKQSKELKGSRAAPVLVVDAPAKPCGRCGRGNHDQKDCKFKSATCHKCGKIGHIAPVCRSKQSGKHPKGQAKKTKWVSSTEPDQTSDSQEESLFVVQNKSSPPYNAELQVNGPPLTMEVDTGAAVSLAPESAVASLLTHSTLQPTGVILKTYTGEQIPVKGTMTVDVKYGQQHYKNLKLLVVSGSGPCLIGRDWLRVVRLDWRKIGKVSATTASVTS